MNIVLYKNNSDDNVINKELTEITTVDAKFKKQSSIVEPVLLLERDVNESILGCNYVYIPKFNRYYFVVDFEVFPSKIFTLTLKVDVLESFKQDILNCKGFVSRQADYNKYYDSEYESEVKKEVDVFKSNSVLDLDIENKVLITVGAVNN